jgi:capsular exopolysaccharide synthesis family protein
MMPLRDASLDDMTMIDRYLPRETPESGLPIQHERMTSLSPRDEEAAGFKIGLADLRSMAWRQRYLVGAVTAVAVLIGLFVTLLMTPIFRAAATVQISQDKSNIVGGQDVTPDAATSDAGRYLKTQEQVIQSRTMAMHVAEALRFAGTDHFITAMGGKPLAASVPSANRDQARLTAAVDLLMTNLKATVPADSRIAAITFDSPDPAIAAQVANAYADAYIEQNIAAAFRSSDYARSYLLKQVDGARDRLAVAERKAIAYARDARLIDASDAAASTQAEAPAATGRSLSTASLVRLNEELNAAGAERIAAEARWRGAQEMKLLEVPEVIANTTVAGLLSDRATLQQQLAQLTQRYRPGNPQVRQLKAQIASINAQVQQIGSATRGSLRNGYIVAQRREGELSSAIERSKREVLSEQQRRVQLNGLAQDVDINRTTLRDLLARYNQVNAASGVIANNLAIVDRAIVPTDPVRPRPVFNLAVALAAGLALGLLLAIAREALNDTLRSPDDVEAKLGLPFLGTTPKVSIAPGAWNTVLSDPSSPLAEAYFSIRATLDFSLPQGQPRTLIVTSSAPSEGKSTTAYALALDYARIGVKTLLVDCDLRRPALHGIFGKRPARGFVEVLTGQVPIGDVLVRDTESALDILPMGKLATNPVQLLSGSALGRFIERYSPVYDLIILDTAPVMGIADTPLIGRFVDGIVLVIEAGFAHRGQAKTAIRRLEETGGTILGVVLSKFDGREAGYGYEYYHDAYAQNRERQEPERV